MADSDSPLRLPLSQLRNADWLRASANLKTEGPLCILIVLSQQPGETGSGVFLREIATELMKLGHQPHILAAHYRRLNANDFPSIPEEQIHTLLFDNGRNSALSEVSFAIPGMSLDMPYLHQPFHSLTDAMLEEYCQKWANKIDHLIRQVEPDVVHANHLWLLPGIISIVAPHVPLVGTYHGSEHNLLKKSRKRFSELISPGIGRLQVVMPVSKGVSGQAVTEFKVPQERIAVIENGYNSELFKVLQKQLVRPKIEPLLTHRKVTRKWDKLVLFVGKYANYKGLQYLIRAASQYGRSAHEDIVTFVVGDGTEPFKRALITLIEELGLQDKVFLTGKLPYQQVYQIMNIADVFVMPSINEAFGLVLLEALACGVRSVSIKRGGPASFVPAELIERDFVTLIRPINLMADGQVDDKDEFRYIKDLAAAIKHQLSAETTMQDRRFIAQAVQNQTWTSRANEISQVYLQAIHEHKQALQKGNG